MTKIILPLLALLAFLGSADAQTPRPAAAGNSAVHAPADMTAQQKQECRDDYAHAVGNLAYQEARLSLTPAQQPLFDRWKNVKLDNARRDAADCATRQLPRSQGKMPTPLDGMIREQENLKRRLADLDAEIPALTAFYNVLSQAQKDALARPGEQAMLVRRRALAPRPQVGPGPAPNPTAQ